MNVHVGSDRRGLVHSLATGGLEKPTLLAWTNCCMGRGTSCSVIGPTALRTIGSPRCHAGIRYRVNRRSKQGRQLSEWHKQIKQARSRTRARGEYAFHVVKRLWGFAKVSYRGIDKDTVRAFAMVALANLYLVRRLLAPQGGVSAVKGKWRWKR